jgi:thiopurine S-methyltransferase
VEPEFWLERWRTNRIGFHRSDVNPRLEEHWPALGVAAGEPVLVPLCGKSLDMRYLEACGHPVIGVELSRIAIEAYFAEGGESFEREAAGRLMRYRGPGTTIYGGNVLELGGEPVEEVRGVFDRGALIAQPPEARRRYAEHLARILPAGARILLLTLDYDQDRIEGPPFSVPETEVRRLYSPWARVERVDRREVDDLPPRFEDARMDGVSELVFRLETRPAR